MAAEMPGLPGTADKYYTRRSYSREKRHGGTPTCSHSNRTNEWQTQQLARYWPPKRCAATPLDELCVDGVAGMAHTDTQAKSSFRDD